MVDFESRALASLGGWNPDPKSWGPYFDAASKATGVPASLLKGVIFGENGGGTFKDSPQGAEGGAQIMPDTAKGLGVDDTRDPRQFILGAAKYLAEGKKATDGTWNGALKYYFGGPDVTQWGTKTARYPAYIASHVTAQGGDPQALKIGPYAPPPKSTDGAPPGFHFETADFGKTKVLVPNGLPQVNLPQSPAAGTGQSDPFIEVSGAHVDQTSPQQQLQALLDRIGSGKGDFAGTGGGAPAQPQSFEDRALQALDGPLKAKAAMDKLLAAPDTPTAGGKPTPASVNALATTAPPALSGQATPTPEQTAPAAAPAAAPWGLPQAVMNGALLGFGPQVWSGESALAHGLGSALSGGGVSGGIAAARQAYNTSLQGLQAGRTAYQKSSPGAALVGETLGALPPTLMGMGAVNALGRAAIPAVAKAAPALANTATGLGELLGGTAGQGATGVVPALARRAADVTSGAVQGAGTSVLQSQLSDAPVGQQAQTGAVAGGLLNSVLGPAGRAVGRALFPPVAPEMARAAKTSTADKLAIRAGQIAQSRLLKTMDRMLELGSNNEQMRNWTRLASNLLGGNTDSLTATEFNALRNAIGKRIEDFATRNGITIDNKLLSDLTDWRKEVRSLLNADQSAKNQLIALVDRVEQDLLTGMAMGNKLAGKDYTDLTRFGGPISQFTRDSDSLKKVLGIKMRKIIDDALERSVPADEVEALRLARRQWFTAVALSPLVRNARATAGVLDPKALHAALARAQQNYAWAEPTALSDLAQLGRVLMSPTAQGDVSKPSNIKSRIYDMMKFSTIPAAIYFRDNPYMVPSVLTGLGSIGAGAAVRKGIQSPFYRNKLADLALGRGEAPSMPHTLMPVLNQSLQPHNAMMGLPPNQ